MRCNLQGLPPNGPALLTPLAFHGGVAAIMLLYLIFWVQMTLIDTLLPLLVLSLFTYYFGFLTLSTRTAKLQAGLKKE